MSKKTWIGRIYLGRDEDGKQLFHWVGRFSTRRQRDDAVAEAKIRLKRGGDPMLPTVDAYVDRYLADYARRNRSTSLVSQTERLKPFREEFAGRSLDIPRAELKDWINSEGRWEGKKTISAGFIPALVSLYNHAIDEDDLPLERNPARKLSHRSKGRSETPPPTEAEFQQLLDACAALKEYAPTMRALFKFAAFTLMRPGELYPLRWSDIDFERMRIAKSRRLFRGALDEPKTGAKLIALTPPARDAITGLSRDRDLVFVSKTGKRMAQSTLSTYWASVLGRADLDFEFYLASKHYGVWFMWTQLQMSPRAIAAQAGWEVRTVDQMLKIYGHGEVGALDEVDAAFARQDNVRRLRIADGTQ